MRYNRFPKQQGFSLTELSIGLVIVAVMAGSALSVAISQTDSTKIDETNSKLDTLEEALASYLAVNKRLPCPADGSLTLSDANFGLEKRTGNDCTDTAPYKSARVYAGVVPTTTLGLPDEAMLDGWGRRIGYAVDYYFASSGTTNYFANTATGTILIYDSLGYSPSGQAAVTLISYGSNGYGAWLRNGGSQIFVSGADAKELENNHLTAAATITAYDGEFTQQLDPSATFDDIVRYKNKWQLVREAGAVISGNSGGNDVCTTARAIVAGTSTVCDTAVNSGGCVQLATEVENLCL